MKLIYTLLLLAASTISAQAQISADDVETIKKIWGKEKKALATEAMNLNPAEAEKFWPLYDKYQESRSKIAQSRMGNIKAYADAYSQMSDSKAKELVNSALKNDKALNKLQGKTFKKMSKALSPTRAAQFLQFESYLDSQVRAELMDALPFLPNPK